MVGPQIEAKNIVIIIDMETRFELPCLVNLNYFENQLMFRIQFQFECRMASLNTVPDVEIDTEGKFKYILVKISAAENESKLIVRGTKKAEFHPDIFAQVRSSLLESHKI